MKMVMTMRARFMTTAAAIAMVTTPAFAADLYAPTYVPPANDPVYTPGPMVVGHLQLGIGYADVGDLSDFFELDDSGVGIFVGAGRANVNLGGAWNVQVETGGGALFKDGNSRSAIGATGHVWTRLNSAAVGAFAGATFPTGLTLGTVGLEGEVYLGAITLGANTSYNWADCSGCDFWNVAGYADFYLTPDWRAGGELRYASADSVDVWGATIDTEYRFSGSPFSLWAEGSYDSVDCCGDPDIWAGLVGFRVFMDAPGTTLHQHDMEVPWDQTFDARLFLFD